MKAFFHCEIEYVNSPHLLQIYEGFYRLSQRNLISISIVKASGPPDSPVIKVKVSTAANKQYTVYYDTLDGFNWLGGKTPQENLAHFKDNTKADFYFKRSFNKSLVEFSPQGCKVLPLGLNYQLESANDFTLAKKLTAPIRKLIPDRYHKGMLYAEDFEQPPLFNKNRRVLFLTRLWNPAEVRNKKLQEEREAINHHRISCIESCIKEFGSRFTGGLMADAFSSTCAKTLIAPRSITRRRNFINEIKSHNICVATTGLHNSIGWKFAEYVACSRAIVSEPLHYDVAGDFRDGNNYHSFTDKNTLMEKIQRLLDNDAEVKNMMYKNFSYYNLFLKPEHLILNTLLAVSTEF